MVHLRVVPPQVVAPGGVNNSFELIAPRQGMWVYFLDIERLAHCLPDVESVEQIDDTHYTGTLVVQLGPVKPKFVGECTIHEKFEPERMIGTFQAKDRGAGSSINAGFAFTLTEPEPNHTTAHYDVDLTIRGRMAAFGGSIIEETAKQLTAAFASAIQQELSGAEPQAQVAGAETTALFPSQAAPPMAPKVSPVRIVLKSIWAVIKDKV